MSLCSLNDGSPSATAHGLDLTGSWLLGLWSGGVLAQVLSLRLAAGPIGLRIFDRGGVALDANS